MHTSVFLEEAIEALQIKTGGKYIDTTYGQGGHSQAVKAKGGQILAIDLDREKDREEISNNIIVVKGNFKDIESIAKREGFEKVDGILFDLGLSMNEIADSNKGFSYQNDDECLDMRLDENQEMTAADVVNSYTQKELTEILMKYSEDIHSEKIAIEIMKKRKIHTVGELKRLIDQVVGGKSYQTYARIFQALRIEVNNELNNLKKALEASLGLLKKDGRIVVISFHSLEDRVVKQFIRKSKDVSGKRIDVEKTRKLQAFERSATLRVIKYI